MDIGVGMLLDELAARFWRPTSTPSALTQDAYRADLRGFARSFPTLDTADVFAAILRLALQPYEETP